MIEQEIELKGIIWEDFVNYKKLSTTLMFPKCNWKCEKECGEILCQNKGLAAAPSEWHDINKIIETYYKYTISEAIVLQGLEPLDSLVDVYTVAATLSDWKIRDDLVIYTGYNKSEINPSFLTLLKDTLPGNKIIIKWGRYIPHQKPHYDPILGVQLASDNQYGEII